MNLQPAPQQPRPAANGYGRRRHEREGSGGSGARVDQYRSQSGKSGPGRPAQAGGVVGGKVGGPSGDRLVYLATCLIGHPVEVQVKNGSLYTGIFHATNADKDFGIILKMAQMTKDGTARGHGETLTKPPQKMLIIPSNELVQVIAKDLPVTTDGFNELQLEKQQELMIDSYISQSRHTDGERVLEPWVPDEDDPQCPDLDNIFDGRWNSSHRNWDQFETNEALFGVKSTFNEDLYTTKLERGPQMKELEKEASRIAREIEGEVTQDLHLAEERGRHLPEDFDIDEETRYSSVFRGRVADDSGFEEDEDYILFNSRNSDTFGDSVAPISSGFSGGLTSGTSGEGVPPSSSSFNVEDRKASGSAPETDNNRVPSSDASRGTFASAITGSRVQSIGLAGDNDSKLQTVKQQIDMNPQISQSEDASLKDQEERKPAKDPVDGGIRGKRTQAESPAESNQRPGSSRSSISDHMGAASASTRANLTPSSSMGSLSSEKSTLNPNAKEFKLNPNAKSFMPSPAPHRPPSPVSDGSFYLQNNASPASHMHGMPVGVGMAPPYVGHQPVIFNPQFAPMHSPQGYMHPNAPQYGQQVLFGHPRQVPYMSGYPPEMPYKGRDY